MNLGVFLTAGWFQMNLSPILNKLSYLNYRYPEFNRITLGVDGYIRYEDFFFPVSWERFLELQGEAEGKRVKFNWDMAYIGVGYLIYHNRLKERNFLVYPSAGVGVSRFKLEAGYIGNVDFNELGDPSQSTSMQNIQYIGILALNSHFDFGFSFGISFGYVFTFYKSPWSTNFGDVMNPPDIKTSGIFGKILVGFAWDEY